MLTNPGKGGMSIKGLLGALIALKPMCNAEKQRSCYAHLRVRSISSKEKESLWERSQFAIKVGEIGHADEGRIHPRKVEKEAAPCSRGKKINFPPKERKEGRSVIRWYRVGCRPVSSCFQEKGKKKKLEGGGRLRLRSGGKG